MSVGQAEFLNLAILVVLGLVGLAAVLIPTFFIGVVLRKAVGEDDSIGASLVWGGGALLVAAVWIWLLVGFVRFAWASWA